jgi:hypothetical protein
VLIPSNIGWVKDQTCQGRISKGAFSGLTFFHITPHGNPHHQIPSARRKLSPQRKEIIALSSFYCFTI